MRCSGCGRELGERLFGPGRGTDPASVKVYCTDCYWFMWSLLLGFQEDLTLSNARVAELRKKKDYEENLVIATWEAKHHK